MFILADIGGTKTRVAGSRNLATFSEPVVMHTPADRYAFADTFEQIVRNVCAGEAVDAVCVGKPSYVDEDLFGRVDAPILFENDTALVGLGEAHYGAGQGSDICVYMTVSTGVNGVRILDGRIDRATYGFEIGGQYMNGEDTLEELVSGTAVQERFGVSSPKELGADSPVWDELALVLAYGVHNTVLHWSPDRVVLGGSMFNPIGIKVDAVASHVEALMRKFPAVPAIVHSRLGDFGGLYGAMVRLRQALE